MLIVERCPKHNKPLYGNGQTDTHMLSKCPDCDYAGDGPGAVRHDLPERYMALKAENERLVETIRKQGKECERRHNLLCLVKEIIDEYFGVRID